MRNKGKFLLLKIIYLTLFLIDHAYCQDFKISSGVYQSTIYENETLEQGKKRIKELAITDALDRAYGKVFFKGKFLVFGLVQLKKQF